MTAPFPPASCLFIGAALAGPAPSVIIPLVRQLSLREQTRTTLTLESSLGEVLCIVVSLAILQSIQLAEVHIGHVIGKLVASFTFAMVIGSIGGYVWSLLLHRVRQLRNAIFTTPAFAFVLYGTADFLRFSGPADLIRLPSRFAATTLKPLVHNETEILFFGEIVFLLKIFFFVYLGLSIQFTDVWALQMGILLTLLLFIARFITVRITTKPDGTPLRDAFIMTVSIPKGTAAAVLAYLPIQFGLPEAVDIKNIINAVVILTILFTSSLVPLAPRRGGWLFGRYGTKRVRGVSALCAY